MFIPKIIVKKSDISHNVNFITELLAPDNESNTSLPFKDRVYGLLPELKGRITDSMTKEQIYSEVENIVKERLLANAKEIDARVKYLQKVFDKLSIPLLSSLLDIFNLQWDDSQSEIICYLGCYPVFPRDIVNKEFWINYNTIDERILKGAVHEIDHFMVYEKWRSMDTNSKDADHNYPNPLWFLEEIIVDPTLNESTITNLIPYEHRAYEQFYHETVADITIMDKIKYLYSTKESIEEFLYNTYEFINNNIKEITEKCG